MRVSNNDALISNSQGWPDRYSNTKSLGHWCVVVQQVLYVTRWWCNWLRSGGTMTCKWAVGSAEKYRNGGTKLTCTKNYIRFTIPVFWGYPWLQHCPKYYYVGVTYDHYHYHYQPTAKCWHSIWSCERLRLHWWRSLQNRNHRMANGVTNSMSAQTAQQFMSLRG